MIRYNQRYILKKIRHTLLKSQLEFEGPYNLIVCTKAVVQVDREGISQHILEVESADHTYKGMVQVNSGEYRRAQKGEVWAHGGVLRYKKDPSFYVMTRYSDEKKAIRRQVNSSRLQLIFIVVVNIMIIRTIILFLTPWLNTL